MKKYILICLLVSATNMMFGQNNVFPTPSGTVGIGSSPFNTGAYLHIRSTINYPRLSIQSTSATGAPGLALGNSSSPFKWTMHYDIAGQFLGFFYEGVGNYMVVNNAGNVGIGTITPKTTLDVGGHLRLGKFADMPAEGAIAEGQFANYILGDAGVQRLKLGVVNDLYTKAEILIDNSNRPDGTIAFRTANGTNTAASTRMFINGDGNVSIGTTDAKGYRFAVNGDAIFTKIKVKTFATWPDYVFDSSYYLPPLREIESYIKTHKHLPEVPSAREIENEGLDLAAMQTVATKKLEELTLYLIEQNKVLQEQAKLIANLQAQIDEMKKTK